MDGSCLFIQSATLWRFMGAFKPFTLRLHTERYDFNDAMLPVKSLFVSVVTFCSVSLLGPFYLYRTPLLEGIEQFSNVAGYKIIAQKSLAFLYRNNETEEREFRESISFTIAPKTIRYLGINLTRDINYLYSRIYK